MAQDIISSQLQQNWPPYDITTLYGGGGSGTPLTLNAPAIWAYDPIDDCMRSISVNGVYYGAIVEVFINGNYVARANSFGGDSVLKGYAAQAEVPIGCSPSVGDWVQAQQEITDPKTGKTIISPLSPPVKVVSHVPYSVLTQHYDNHRTGWYPYAGESWRLMGQGLAAPLLTVSNLQTLGLKQKLVIPLPAPGGQVYTQPLYLHHQYFGAQGAHNAIYVATEEDWVFCFDADNGAVLWKRNLLQTGEQAVDTNDLLMDSSNSTVWDDSKNRGVMNIAPKVGVTGTPVIDCGCDCGCGDKCKPPIMYVVSKLKNTDAKGNKTFFIYLNALWTDTGGDAVPRQIISSQGEVVGQGGGSKNGFLNFIPEWANQRPALLLQNGIIYIGFAGHGDAHQELYHGWLFAHDVSTLKKLRAFVTTPDGGLGGIWQSGMGIAGDGCSIYFTVGNGDFQKGSKNFGNSVLKLSSDLKVISSFTPIDQVILNDGDIDLGSGGVLLIPDRQFAPFPPYLLVTCGKDAEIFVLNRDGLGGYLGDHSFDSGQPNYGTYGNNTNAVTTAFLNPGTTSKSKIQGNGVWGGPAYFYGPIDANNTIGELIFYAGNPEGGGPPLTSFQLKNGNLTANHVTAGGFGGRGGPTPVITSNQQVPGTGIVWAVNHQNPNNPKNISLRAYSVTNLGARLVNDLDCGLWDSLYPKNIPIVQVVNDPTNNPDLKVGKPYPYDAGGPYIEPTVINGKVYVGSDTQITVFSL